MEILISLIVCLIVFGLIIWAIGMLPLDIRIKQVVYVLCVIIFILVLLGFMGWGPVRLRH